METIRKFATLLLLTVVAARYLLVPLSRLAWRWAVILLWDYNPVMMVGEMVEGLIQQFEPPPPPPPKTPTRIVMEHVDQFACQLWQFDVVELLIWSVVGLAVLMGVRMLILSMKGTARKTLLAARGISFESMRAGSALVKGEMPKYQVSIRQPGLLRDSHIGFGIRVGNYLVTPQHVLLDVGGEELVLYFKNNKVMLNAVNAIRSRVVTDLVYIWLPENIWVRLGASSAKMSPSAEFPMVSCAGYEGVSSGLVRRSQIVGVVCYYGSTLPGMSGAAYDSLGSCCGIHVGAMSGANMGVSSVVVSSELSRLVRQESSSDVAAAYSEKIGAPKKQAWSSIHIGEIADRNWGDDAWHLEQDFDYDKIIDFDIESKKTPKVPSLVLPMDGIRVQQQSKDGPEALYQLVPNVTTAELQGRVISLEEKVTQLEEALLKIQQSSAEKFPCDMCTVVCRTQERLDGHLASAHKRDLAEKPNGGYTHCEVCGTLLKRANLEKHQTMCIELKTLKESAIPSDFKKSVKVSKETPFLAKRSRRSKSPPLRTTLTTKDTNRRSPSLAGDRSEIASFQTMLQQFLKEVRQVMAGQNSAATPN